MIGEAELTDAQRADWWRFVEFHNAEGTGRALFPDDAEIVTAVADRLVWLESERERLIALTEEQDAAWACAPSEAARLPAVVIERDRAVAEAAVLRMRLHEMYPPTFRDDDGVLRERASPLDKLAPVAAQAAAVLAAAGQWTDRARDDDGLSYALAQKVYAYRAALAGKGSDDA